MSHLQERKERNCLNCNAEVHGKYCSICGQENLEPAESVWHLVSHFFNDITHFDGKFFSSLKLLLLKPGFLSYEYKMGRRNSYLNPVRMYVFTSFLFFFIFFAVFKTDTDLVRTTVDVDNVTELGLLDETNYQLYHDQINNMPEKTFRRTTKKLSEDSLMTKESFFLFTDSIRADFKESEKKLPLKKIAGLGGTVYNKFNEVVASMDSSEFASFTRSINNDTAMSRSQYQAFLDSARTGDFVLIASGKDYKDRAEYDSFKKAGLVKDGWFREKTRLKEFELREKYGSDSATIISKTFDILAHNFPQMLFISLPLFALFLKFLYRRQKEFYLVSHGIYTVHLYIFYFIVLLVIIFLNKLDARLSWHWLDTLSGFLAMAMFFYEYKAMRNFYGQRRAKTVLKFLVAVFARFVIILILLILFFFLSILKV